MEIYREAQGSTRWGLSPDGDPGPVFCGAVQYLLSGHRAEAGALRRMDPRSLDPDPYYVLPILMGASMLASQKLPLPRSTRRSAKVMLILPVIFTFMFISFPSGLVLYWTVNNILTIGQQIYINRSPAK